MIVLYIPVKRDIVMETYCERESNDSMSSDSILRLQEQWTVPRNPGQQTDPTQSTQPSNLLTLTSQPTQVQLPRTSGYPAISIPAIVGQSLGNTIGQTTKEIKVLNDE